MRFMDVILNRGGLFVMRTELGTHIWSLDTTMDTTPERLISVFMIMKQILEAPSFGVVMENRMANQQLRVTI